MQVLIIDDDERFARLLQTYLEMGDSEVTVGPDGGTGLALARAAPFALAMIDLTLPDQDGTAVAAALKELSPPPFVVLMSGLATRLDDETLLQAGIDAVLPKPWRPQELSAVLSRAADRGRA